MVQAVGNNVIIKLHHDDKVGSIIIPGKAQAQGSGFYGEVIAVGWDVKLDIKTGDKIVFFRNEGFKIDHEGVEYLSIKEKHILGVME